MPISLIKSRIVIGCFLFARAASAEVCPADIHGGWEADFPITGLTNITIEINRDRGGDYSARLFSSDHEEAVAVWQGTQRLRLQSQTFQLSFEGGLSPAEERIDKIPPPGVQVVSPVRLCRLTTDGNWP